MTSLTSALQRLAHRMGGVDAGDVPADVVLAPATIEDVATVMALASAHRAPVLIWGGGTHQGYGYPVDAAVALVTTGLNQIVEWDPDDLTVVVEGGVRVADLEDMLTRRGQTAVLQEVPGDGTVGGAVAAGISGWRRNRYGPTRDRILEAVLATGDGRVIRSGGRVVKNVTGYDIARLAAGSFGALGVIGRLCLKLWPLPEASATVRVSSAESALATAVRPLAVIEMDHSTGVYLSGTRAEVERQATDLGGDVEDGLVWPEEPGSRFVIEVRVPPGDIAAAVERATALPGVETYRAAHGVGTVAVGLDEVPVDAALSTRRWAEMRGGALVITRRPIDVTSPVDPWGSPPGSLHLQRRVKEAFDPIGVSNPGRLPGAV